MLLRGRTINSGGCDHFPHADYPAAKLLEVRPHTFDTDTQKLIKGALLDSEITKSNDFFSRLGDIVANRMRAICVLDLIEPTAEWLLLRLRLVLRPGFTGLCAKNHQC